MELLAIIKIYGILLLNQTYVIMLSPDVWGQTEYI